MVNAIWMPLWQLLDIPNSLVILSILVCLFTLTSFVLRLNRDEMEGEPGSSCVFMPNEPAEMRLTYQSSPLNLILCEPNENQKQDFDSGIKVAINTRSSFWFTYFWGPDIQSFHANMTKDWRQLKSDVINQTYLLDANGEPNYLEGARCELIFDKHKELVIKPLKMKSEDLGPSPRTRFPLLVLLFVNEDDLHDQLRENDTVALFSVIHVKDSFCGMDSNFVFKLNKMANNQILNVRDLYARSNDSGEGVCVICETEEIEVALLPCKHFCVCEDCFDLLPQPKQCPLCRSYITTFFKHKKRVATYGNSQPMTSDSSATGSGMNQTGDQPMESGPAGQPADGSNSALGQETKKPWFKKIFSRS